jgi:23S rRNA pseudouridine1911/1915/1917 synthase
MTHLAKQFYDHTIDREYLALVWGNFDETEGTVDEYIGRDPKNRLIMKVFPEQETGKHAITHYKVLEDLYYVSLVQCRLETGRTHQIRTHMKYLGHPLFSDYRYGGDKILKGTVFTKYKQFVMNCLKIIQRQALHAAVLEFEHPTKGERMRFESELPEDMNAVLEKWRNYVSTRQSN